MMLKDLDRNFLDRTDWRVAGALAFGVACWALIFAMPCPHPDFWTDFAAAARIRPARTMLDAFWLFPVGAVFDLLGVGKTLSVCGFLGRVGLGLVCGGVYLCLRALWYELLDEEIPELPVGFWNTRFGSICGALVFCLCSFAWKESQFLSSGFLAVLVGGAAILLWLNARHSHGLGCLAAAYVLCGVLAAAHPIMMGAAIGFVIYDIRMRRIRAFLEFKGDEGMEQMQADQRELLVTGVSLFFGILGGVALCVSSVYRFAIVPEPVLWNLFDVWFADWCGRLADSFVSWGPIASAGFAVLSIAILALGRNLRMTPGGGAMPRNIFLVVLLLACSAFGVRRMTEGVDGRKLDVIRQYVDVVVESCRAGVSWLFTDGAFDDLIRLEMRDRGVGTAVLSLVSSPTVEESAVFRDYAPEMLDRDMFGSGGAEVFRYWAQERRDRLEQSAWLIGSDTVRKYDAKAPICVSGGVLRYGKAAANDVMPVEGEMRRIESVIEKLALQQGSSLDHADDRIRCIFCQMVHRIADFWEERRLGHEMSGDILKARNAEDRAKYFNGICALLDGDWEMTKALERLRPTSNLVLTPQEGLEVALRRRDYILAMRFARPILEANPTNAVAHFAMGMGSVEANDERQAVWHFKEAVRNDPENELAQVGLAKVYQRLGQWENALKCVENAVRLCPNSDLIRRVLVEIREDALRK